MRARQDVNINGDTDVSNDVRFARRQTVKDESNLMFEI